MRIGIDVRYLSHGIVGGVQAYVRHFVPALINQGAGHEIYLYADRKRPLELEHLPEHATVRFSCWRSPIDSVYNDLFLWQQMARDQLDVVHFPGNYGFGPPGARTVITLHDAINIMPLAEILRGHEKKPRTVAMMTYLHVMTVAAVRRASMLLTVSEYSKDEIARLSGFERERIRVVPSGPSPALKRVEDSALLGDVRRRHGIEGGYVLADALKNPAALVRAWSLLSDQSRAGRQIVFFSRRADPPSPVFDAVASGMARLLVRPSNADLAALYSMAEAFVFPSPFEGFGLPVVEAMVCGAPVITSSRGSLPEVVGDAALVVDVEDIGGLARALEQVLLEPGVARRLKVHGYKRAAQYTWPNNARRILDGYETSLGLSIRPRP